MVSASMGIYLFNTDVLIPVLLKDAEDPEFEPRLRPRHPAQDGGRLQGYSFNFVDENKKEALYWRDVGTLEAYYEANMDLVVRVAGVQPVRQALAACARISANIRRRSSCSPSPDAPAAPWIPSSPRDDRLRCARCATACSPRTCA